MMIDPTTEVQGSTVVSLLVREALQSGCDKSARGVVLLREWETGNFSMSVGTNKPLQPCKGRSVCGDKCSTIAVHAEMAAVLRWPGYRPPMVGFHAKVDRVTERLVPTGGPSCVGCSKHLRAVGLELFWLYQSLDSIELAVVDKVLPPTVDGGAWVRYDMLTFDKLSMQASGLGAFV